jgi:phosphatidylserine/phosphatidylglycerophosphate/cardiolipin synthase-like enzyme
MHGHEGLFTRTSATARRTLLVALPLLLLSACGTGAPGGDEDAPWPTGGKADEWAASRRHQVMLTAPHCDVCSAEDKAFLQARSPIVARLAEAIDGAVTRVDVAQYTFSDKTLEAALLRAHQRGVAVRLAIDAGQNQPGTVAARLQAAGVPVHFVTGKGTSSQPGLLHAKFMRVDDKTLFAGSHNWSSTGMSINEENDVLTQSAPGDPLLDAFDCAFEAIWGQRPDDAAACSTPEVAFTPSSGPFRLLRDQIRAATSSVDILMHHLMFDKLLKELANAAARGVRVRIVVNANTRAETNGADWDRLRAAGGRVRYKLTNDALYQLLHHKLAVIDGRVLVDGSGNWSGSAFFNNYEFYLLYTDRDVVAPFNALFARLWSWALDPASLDGNVPAAHQDAGDLRAFFGNLHAHFSLSAGGRLLDDGHLEREIDGTLQSVATDAAGDPMRYAYEYARDVGQMDFLVLSPHVVDDRADDPADIPSMSRDGYATLLGTARAVTAESQGRFLALGGMEWSTNSTGNHVNVLGSEELAKEERGSFADLYEHFLPRRAAAGDPVVLMLNHPRTFRQNETTLAGTYDQVYGVNLTDIESASQLKQKFNDYGLDDYPPLRDLRPTWLAGEALPDPAVVDATLANIAAATRPYARLMEVTLNRGEELTTTDAINPSLVLDDDGVTMVRRTKVHTDWDYYLLHDFRLAPVASHDNHYANWGTAHSSRTVVYAETLDEGSLLAALADRRVAASEDQNLDVRLYADGRVRAGSEMLTLADRVTLTLRASDPDFAGPFEVTVWTGRVGDAVARPELRATVAAGAWYDLEVPLPDAGRYFVYLEVLEAAPDRMAWTAPIFVERP